MLKLLTGASSGTAKKWIDWLDKAESATRKLDTARHELDAASSALAHTERLTHDEFRARHKRLHARTHPGVVIGTEAERERDQAAAAKARQRGSTIPRYTRAGDWAPPALGDASDAKSRERFMAGLERDALRLDAPTRRLVLEIVNHHLRPAHESLKAAEARRTQAETTHSKAEAAMAKVEASRPVLSDKAADAINGAVESATKEVQRVEQALAKAVADREALEAQHDTLDQSELAAELALAQTDAQRDAARRSLEQAQRTQDDLAEQITKARNLEAGLQGAIDSAQAVTDRMKRHHSAVMQEVFRDELLEAEQRLLTVAIEYGDAFDALAAVLRKLDSVTGRDVEYSMSRGHKLPIPRLYATRGELSGADLPLPLRDHTRTQLADALRQRKPDAA